MLSAPTPEAGRWFYNLFGFWEDADGSLERWRDVKTEFVLEPGGLSPAAPQTLSCRRNGRSWKVGVFSTPTLGELEMQARAALQKKRLRDGSFLQGRSTVEFEYGDIAEHLQNHAKYGRATFQVASQFNCLEYISPTKTKADGVGIYEYDKTQGPACSIACGPATVVRNYFTADLGLGEEINNLGDTMLQLENRFVQVRGGYTLPQHEGALRDLRGHLAQLGVFRDGTQRNKKQQADHSCLKAVQEGCAGARHLRLLLESVRVGVHAGVEVTSTNWGRNVISRPEHLVTQVFCSACSVAYDASSSADDWEPISRIALDAAYEACVWAAVLEACKYDGAEGSRTVVFTILGGGAFGNPVIWIADAIGRALHQLELAEVGLKVVINNYNEHVPAEVKRVHEFFNKRPHFDQGREEPSGGRGAGLAAGADGWRSVAEPMAQLLVQRRGEGAVAPPLAAAAVRARLRLPPRGAAVDPAAPFAHQASAAGARLRVLFPVVHVQPVGHYATRAVEEARVCFENGADGVFLCAWYVSLRSPELATVEQVNECYAAVRAAYPDVAIGVNYLRNHISADQLPSDADALWTDAAGTSDGSEEHARAVRERQTLQRRCWAQGRQPLHFGAFTFDMSGSSDAVLDDDLPAAATLAKDLLEVYTSSGPATGVAMDAHRAARVRAAVGESEVLAIASGLDELSAVELLPFFDVFLVNSSLMQTMRHKQARHFLPWTCPQCTALEEDYPTMCNLCNYDRSDDDSYAAARAASAAAEQEDALERMDGRKVRRLADLVHSATMDNLCPREGVSADGVGCEAASKQDKAVLDAVANPPPVLESFDLAGVAAHIRAGKCSNVIVLAGAGISVSAGIPDFRTPGTGLYDNLAKYNLPEPSAVFDIHFFNANPAPFYQLAKELFPGQYNPTPTHNFIRLLHEHGLLRRCFTQNIDSLEAEAGIPNDKIVAAHGNFDSATCIQTGAKVAIDEVRTAIMEGEEGWRALNAKHGGLVKPDIVFFGEQLPERFYKLAGIPASPGMDCSGSDLACCDLLIVMGTSLVVQPFASLIDLVPKGCPRLLLNRQAVAQSNPLMASMGHEHGFLFGETSNYRDACHLGNCDDAVRQLAALLGWETELDLLVDACGGWPQQARPELEQDVITQQPRATADSTLGTERLEEIDLTSLVTKRDLSSHQKRPATCANERLEEIDSMAREGCASFAVEARRWLPWTCPNCTFVNEQYVSLCEVCDEPNYARRAQQQHELAARSSTEDDRGWSLVAVPEEEEEEEEEEEVGSGDRNLA